MFNLPRLIINKISPSKLRVKGPPKFAIHRKNHISLRLGKIFRAPLFLMSLREWDRSYIILAQENIPDEHTPCAIMTTIAPQTPQLIKDIVPIIISAMCTTDE